jgi:hypothetical protein
MSEEQKKQISEYKDKEFKKYMSDAQWCRGKKIKRSTKLKMAEAHTGHITKPLTKKRISVAKSKRLINKTTGETYASVIEASVKTGLNKAAIAYACRKGTLCNNMFWEYIDKTKNVGIHKSPKKSGVIGIRWNARMQRWQAKMYKNKKEIYIGTYIKLKDAEDALQNAKIQWGKKMETETTEKKYSGYGYHGGGRKSEGKSANVAIRCKPEDLEKIKRNARDAGMTVSEYICKRCAE